jgi:hypothetical protein
VTGQALSTALILNITKNVWRQMDKNNCVTFRCTVEGSGGWLNKKVSPPKQFIYFTMLSAAKEVYSIE